ncbi:hypothetical protein IMSAGC004_03286 [Bacteroidaceae bacterium]|nr:hypothetical protein IMSAGC004_03286 [Bacteroidaceae bacterium]
MKSMLMKCKIIYLFLFLGLLVVSCGGGKLTEPDGQVYLSGGDTLSFPLDNTTYYLCKVLFQFEDKGREYLLFQNDRTRGTPRFLIFDVEKQEEFKRVPLYKEGPNGIPEIAGGCFLDMNRFIVTTHSPFFYLVDDQGTVLRKYRLWDPDADGEDRLFVNSCISTFYSYYASPGILRDSLLYFKQDQVGYPRKPDDWKNLSLFVSVDMNTGEMKRTDFKFPSIFKEEEQKHSTLYESECSYAHTGREVAVSFHECDSIFVSSDFHHVHAYSAKSRYFPAILPKAGNINQDLVSWLQEEYLKYQYHHLLYDKYRDVFYRFALQPYRFPKNKPPVGTIPYGQEFSIVILNNKYEIIGETRFPGNTYVYRMCFVGKKGLYLSLNNEENPCFDEDKLMFRCFTLQENK